MIAGLRANLFQVAQTAGLLDRRRPTCEGWIFGCAKHCRALPTGSRRYSRPAVCAASLAVLLTVFIGSFTGISAFGAESFDAPDKSSPELAWWRTSMETHDQRIAWWREARFGMFVHWGVYSSLGNEYH